MAIGRYSCTIVWLEKGKTHIWYAGHNLEELREWVAKVNRWWPAQSTKGIRPMCIVRLKSIKPTPKYEDME